MQHPGGWQRCTEEPGIAMHGVHHCEQWTANKKMGKRYNMDIYLIRQRKKAKGNLEGAIYRDNGRNRSAKKEKQSLMQMADAKKVSGSGGTFCKSDAAVTGKSAKILFPKQSISVVSESAGMRFRQI